MQDKHFYCRSFLLHYSCPITTGPVSPTEVTCICFAILIHFKCEVLELCHKLSAFSDWVSLLSFHAPRVSKSISKKGSRQRSNWRTPLDFREIADICPSPLLAQSLSFFATRSLFLFHIWDLQILLSGMAFNRAHFSKHTLWVGPSRMFSVQKIICALCLQLQYHSWL